MSSCAARAAAALTSSGSSNNDSSGKDNIFQKRAGDFLSRENGSLLLGAKGCRRPAAAPEREMTRMIASFDFYDQ